MQRKKAIPKNPRFDYATNRAHKLLIELNINAFPVDPFEIIKHFSPNWCLLEYSELKINTGEKDPLEIKKHKAEAKSTSVRGSSDYLIVYDKNVRNEHRIRWTLAHEIGHIILGHLDHFEATGLYRRGLTKSEYDVLEVEAHWFASELLSPKPIMRHFNFDDSFQGISLICDISKDAAVRKLNRLKNPYVKSYPYANKLLRNFYGNLVNKGYLSALFKTATRYVNSHLYPDFCKYCRICKNCNSYIENENQSFCHICGVMVDNIHKYSPYKNYGGFFYMGDDLFLNGIKYFEIKSIDTKRVLFCPLCKNHEFSKDAEYCRICSTPLFNKCTKENKIIATACRYCPDCGNVTTFKDVYEKIDIITSNQNFVIPKEFDDYMDYDYWEFIKMTTLAWEKDIDLYTALDGAKPLLDEGDFVILFNDINSFTVAKTKIDVLTKCIREHADTNINQVRCIYAL